MNRLPWLVTTVLLGAVVGGLAILRGVSRLTVVIVSKEPFDVLDDVEDAEEVDELDDVEYETANRSHGYVPAV